MSRNKPEIQTSAQSDDHFSLSSYHIYAPTGCIHIKGSNHLFILKRPLNNVDGAVEWAHLESQDLLHWKEQNVVGHDGTKGELLSGYIILDYKNTSGLGNSNRYPLVGIFNNKESPNLFYLIYSKDHGAAWDTYGTGQVLDTKKSSSCDPFVFWHEPSGKWIMLITIPNEYKVNIYASKSLIKWDLINDFGGHPSFNRKWSHATMGWCQSIHNKDIYKWILMIGISEGEVCNRYFVGEFDGKSFKCDHALDTVLRVDHGRDLYAPTLGAIPGQPGLVLMGQLSHPIYQDFLPTQGWKGMLILPHTIQVGKEADGSYRLLHAWIESRTAQRTSGYEFSKSSMSNEVEWPIPVTDEMEFELLIDSHKGCIFEFDFGSKTKMFITWDVAHHQLTLDRTSKNLGFHPAYYSLDQATVSNGHILSVRMILSKYSIEILADGGKVSMTSLFFSPHPLQRFRITGKQFAAGGKIWNLNNPRLLLS